MLKIDQGRALLPLDVHWNIQFTQKAALVYSASLKHPDAVLVDSAFMQATLTDGVFL